MARFKALQHGPRLRAPALPVRLSISIPMVMREGKACGLINRSGLRVAEAGGEGQRQRMVTTGAQPEGGMHQGSGRQAWRSRHRQSAGTPTDRLGLSGAASKTPMGPPQQQTALALPPTSCPLPLRHWGPAAADSAGPTPHLMPVVSQNGMSTSSYSFESTPFCPCREENLSPAGQQGRGQQHRCSGGGGSRHMCEPRPSLAQPRGKSCL